MTSKPTLADITSGFEFRPILVDVSVERVQEYLGVLQATPLDSNARLVPSEAAITFALGALLDQYDLPAGTVHTTQDVRVERPLRLGTKVMCTARVSNRSHRGEMAVILLEISLTTHRDSNEVAMVGTSTLLIQQPS
ncbi:MAG: hypothetical protein QF652_01280 [Dehalococcoidia bacterium]|nr:hypothetical protein [Dehalococcoidia bacterium]